jgi:hypothetical protein
VYHIREPGERRILVQGRVRVGSARRGAGIRSILVGTEGRWSVALRERLRFVQGREGMLMEVEDRLMEVEDRRGPVQPREEGG